MGRCGDEVRDALVRQWEAIAAAVATVDLEIASRVRGWRNREVVAHLCLQPALLRRFAAAASMRDAVVDVAANLAGTRSLAGLIDASAREAAEAGRVDFARAVEDALPSLRAADLSATVVTMQGPIRLVDYLITRCVEAVVHGSDLIDPVSPDRVAQAITARALLEVLAVRAPYLVREARQLPLPV
jgi:Mycothiol maleylpyruvate isomerase N-terminal domain